MTVSGFKVTLFNWNETGNNSKLKLSKANIKKQTVLIEECEAHYEEAGVPLPKDIVTSMTVTLCKIRMAATYKVKDDARNERPDLPFRLILRLYGAGIDRTGAPYLQTQDFNKSTAASKLQHDQVHYLIYAGSRRARA